MDEKPSVLFCTAYGAGYGTGHTMRTLSLIRTGSALYSSTICIVRGKVNSFAEYSYLPSGVAVVDRLEEAGRTELVVSDMRDTGKKEIAALSGVAPVLTIDDCGPGSAQSAVSIFTLPTAFPVQGNLLGADYLVIDERIQRIQGQRPEKSIDVLVSFGGEDPLNLTAYITGILNSIGIIPVVVTGPMYRHDMSAYRCRIFHYPHDFHEILSRAKILITSFGMTMYEAFYLRTPVILYNHSSYHFALAQSTPAINFGYFGGPHGDLRKQLKVALYDGKLLSRSVDKCAALVDGKGASRIASIIAKAAVSGRNDCLFQHRRPVALKRSESSTLFRCRSCGDLFQFSFSEDQTGIYADKRYFLLDYKRQYGRTYIEDRDNISGIGRKRLEVIERYVPVKGRVLDVGCALGFFLDVARERGWDVEGVEISPYAGEWAKKYLSISVRTGNFLDVFYEESSFDVITLFFVVEHFYNVEKVIEKVYTLLKPGGMVAIGLPNRGGISYRMNRRMYISEHPTDHYFDTKPGNLVRLMKRYGFRKKHILITGIHPERFYAQLGRWVEKLKKDSVLYSLMSRVYTMFAKFFGLGDTFEYYGIKIT